MMLYLAQPRNRIIVKGHRCFSFVKNMGKNISEKLTHKYSQKPLDHAKKFQQRHLKLLQKE